MPGTRRITREPFTYGGSAGTDAHEGLSVCCFRVPASPPLRAHRRLAYRFCYYLAHRGALLTRPLRFTVLHTAPPPAGTPQMQWLRLLVRVESGQLRPVEVEERGCRTRLRGTRQPHTLAPTPACGYRRLWLCRLSLAAASLVSLCPPCCRLSCPALPIPQERRTGPPGHVADARRGYQSAAAYRQRRARGASARLLCLAGRYRPPDDLRCR